MVSDARVVLFYLLDLQLVILKLFKCISDDLRRQVFLNVIYCYVSYVVFTSTKKTSYRRVLY